MIVLAWGALFHAIAYKKGKKPWHKRPGKTAKGDRYVRIDGDPKHWDLAECIKQHFGGTHPAERRNLEFLVGLRNKIEHRHLPELDAGLYGECQASLLNLEDLISVEFGDKYSLTEQLAVSLQFTRVIPSEKKAAAKILAGATVKTVREYVETFRGGLPAAVLNSTKYSFNVFLVPRVVGRKSIADVAVEFVKVDEASKEELERMERLNVLIKEKHIPIANLDLHKPSEVVAKVGSALLHRFTMSNHTAAWHHYGVRPDSGAARPETTMSQYCVYDVVHADYVYTTAWIDKLAHDLKSAENFQRVTGRDAVPK